MTATDDVLFTRAEAAEWFGVHIDAIRRWHRYYGLAPVIRRYPYRYRFADLVAADRRARGSGTGRPRKT